MNLVGAGRSSEAAILRLALEVTRLLDADEDWDANLANGCAELFGADGGVGLTTWNGVSGPAAAISVVTSEGVDMPPGQALRAARFAAAHPSFPAMARVGTREPVRTSDLVVMDDFWQTPTFEAMHGWQPDARYPAAIVIHASAGSSVFLGLHRSRRDFDGDDLSLLAVVQSIVAPAVAYRFALDAAVRRLAELGVVDGLSSGILSQREKEVLALAASGLTNGAIGRRLGISERTVRKHLSAVYAETGSSGRAAAVAWLLAGRTTDRQRRAAARGATSTPPSGLSARPQASSALPLSRRRWAD